MASARNGMPFRTGSTTSIVATTTSQDYGLCRFSANRHRVERVPRHNARRLPDRGGSRRYVGEHQRHGANLAIVADANVSQKLRISAQLHIVAKDRGTAPVFPVSYSYALSQRAVLAQHGIRIEEHVTEVPNPQTLSDGAGFRQADS